MDAAARQAHLAARGAFVQTELVSRPLFRQVFEALGVAERTISIKEVSSMKTTRHKESSRGTPIVTRGQLMEIYLGVEVIGREIYAPVDTRLVLSRRERNIMFVQGEYELTFRRPWYEEGPKRRGLVVPGMGPDRLCLAALEQEEYLYYLGLVAVECNLDPSALSPPAGNSTSS